MNVIAVDAEKVSGFKLKITHVVTIGCSWTYCQGLDSPSTQGWPALVAKKLNVPLVNLAVPGVGNDFIHRVSHEYIYKNYSYISSDSIIRIRFLLTLLTFVHKNTLRVGCFRDKYVT
jgi:hypothetical protein